MKIFEVRVTDTSNDNDLCTVQVERSDESDTAQEVMNLLNTTMANELVFTHGDEVIEIFEASDGEGYMYNVYASAKDREDGNDSYGGQCTGTLANAIEMALAGD